MQVDIDPILEELLYMKSEGVTDIPFSLEAMDALGEDREAVASGVASPAVELETAIPQQVTAIALDSTSVSKSLVKSLVVHTESKGPIVAEPKSFILIGETKQQKWDCLKDLVLNCPECNKHLEPGGQVMFGSGNLDADILFCGDGPAVDEEGRCEPFVGESGQLLGKIIGAMGFKRTDVYMTNLMNWRSQTSNGQPTVNEMKFCLPYLKAQIDIIKPKVIVALGATAVNGLLGKDTKRKMGEVRGKWKEFVGSELMITFHPSYLLRNNTNRTKRLVWEDMLLVMERLDLTISEKQKSYFKG